MIQRQHGSVLFLASTASLFGIPNVIAYAAVKSAYVGIVRTLAAEFSADNVRVNAIAPGWISSDMMRKALTNDPARRDKILDRTPMGKFGDADDIGWAAGLSVFISGEICHGRRAAGGRRREHRLLASTKT
jgi:gluconate 5-dehydrogenase